MKAIRFHAYGGAEQLVLDEVPVPVPGPDEVLVRVQASSVNPADWKFRAGWFRDFVPLPLPFIPGGDIAGTVEQVGQAVTGFMRGQRVFGMRDVQSGGACAEFAVVPARHLALVPDALSLEQAAAVPVAALTAWSAVMDLGQAGPGQTVLIHAGSGGVGTFAVQFARIAGARVITTTSGANVEWVRDLGADRVIDYPREDFALEVRNADLVIDALGGEVQRRSIAVLRPGGMLVTLQPPGVDPALASGHGLRSALVQVTADGERLARIAALLAQGAVRVVVDRVFPLAEAAAAHRYSESGRARGKIVLLTD